MMVFWTAFCMCVSMFTVLPAPRAAWNDELTPLRTACLPLVGLLIGALWLGIAYLARWLLPHALSSAVIAAVPEVRPVTMPSAPACTSSAAVSAIWASS